MLSEIKGFFQKLESDSLILSEISQFPFSSKNHESIFTVGWVDEVSGVFQ